MIRCYGFHNRKGIIQRYTGLENVMAEVPLLPVLFCARQKKSGLRRVLMLSFSIARRPSFLS